ncbi:MAG TPA: hypothetical protein VG735_07765 [Caulobacterales bacterium]|nr:hypothetical protein [Caulobacterales bacterium]
MRLLIFALLAALTACAAPAVVLPDRPATVRGSITTLISEVCLPYIIEHVPEKNVVQRKGFTRIMGRPGFYAPGTPPFYVTHYVGVPRISLLHECQFSTEAAVDEQTMLAAVTDALAPRAATWAARPTTYFTHMPDKIIMRWCGPNGAQVVAHLSEISGKAWSTFSVMPNACNPT